MFNKDVCPHCGGEDFVEGVQNSHANVHENKIFYVKDQPLYHIICLRCGTIVRSYVKHPEKLLPKEKV